MDVSSSGNETAHKDESTKDSADHVKDYLESCIHYILFKRMIYPKEKFQDMHKFGTSLVALRDSELQDYISAVLRVAHSYALKQILRRVVLCIQKISTGDIVERWQFRILPVGGLASPRTTYGLAKTESVQQVHSEISQIIKQIGVSFIPPLEHACSFKLLLYTLKTNEITENWIHAGPHLVKPGTEELLHLRDVDTPSFKLQAEVVFTTDTDS